MKLPQLTLDRTRIRLVATLLGIVIVLAGVVTLTIAVNGAGDAKSYTAVDSGKSSVPAAPLVTPTVPAAPTPSATPEAADDWLLPNLVSHPPEEPIIEVSDDGTRQLRFASIIANTGIGPVETRPNDNVGCPAGERHASQILYHDADGDQRFDRSVDVETTSRPAGCMVDHAEHDHWHFDAAARYVLTDTGSDQPIVSADKVSFCWRDNRAVESAAEVTYDQYYPEQDECGHGDVQGITPGWADVYSNRLADQHLNLPGDLASGVYCLWNSADPYNLLVESDDSDNTAVTALELIGAEVRVVLNVDGCTSPPGLPG